MDVPKFDVLIEAVLYKVYGATVRGESSWFSYGDIGGLFDGSASQGYVSKCLGALVGRELVDRSQNGMYSIAARGILYVEQQLEDRGSVIFNYDKHGDAWLQKQSVGARDEDEPILELAGDDDTVADEDGVPLVTVPASDRIVSLDHNSPDYQETLKALSKLSEEATKSNEFSALFADPEDRIVVLSQIDTAIQLLKNENVIPNVVKKVLQYPINVIKENMPGAALGALASKAWDWVVKLLENLG